MIELKKNESDKKSGELVKEKSYYVYVPIIKSLERTLIKHDINKMPPTNHGSPFPAFSSYRDGTFYKNHPFFSTTTAKLELILFSDDYNICDPLGPAKTKYKTNGVYYKVGNLDWVSEANPIKLIQLCFTKDIVKFGYNCVFRRLVDDLKILERSGVKIEIEGKIKEYIGSILLFTADNLGAHSIIGLPQNFSNSLNICRFCYFCGFQLKKKIYQQLQCETRSVIPSIFCMVKVESHQIQF
jgi:hypothetical protein